MSVDSLGKRIMIIGSSGSGKTTLAIELGSKLDLPVIHLDKQFWNAGWVEMPREQWLIKQAKLLEGDSWVVDGNYGGSLDIRLKRADTVIFLDFSRYLCMYRVIKRWISYRGKTRDDMGEGCLEKIDLPFLKFVWRFPVDSRGIILDGLRRYDRVNVLTLKNPNETGLFLESL